MSARYTRCTALFLEVSCPFVLIILTSAGVLGNRVLTPLKISAILGKNVTLGCRVEVASNFTLTQSAWERQMPSGSVTLAVYNPDYGTSIHPEYKHRLAFLSPSFHDATIVLEDVGYTDMGVYTCKVATFPLGNTQASTTVSVLVEPKVYVSAGSSALIDGANKTTVATCIAERARPPAVVSWESDLFGTSEAHLQDESDGTTTSQVHYTWQPNRHSQGHTITCVVHHPAMQSDFRIPFQLNVQFAPDILVVGYDSNWFVGRENVELKCKAKANPSAHHFRWMRLDGEMPQGVEVVNNSLVFARPLQRNDSGVYRCEVGNDIGLRSRDLRIRVHEMSQEQRTSTMAMAGAIMGAILALFLISVVTIVLLSARKVPPLAYPDKVIDLPPTHKPPPPYSEGPTTSPPAALPPLIHPFQQAHRPEEGYELTAREEPSTKFLYHGARKPAQQPLFYQEWICHQNGADKVYINHREHYV
ncbi:nectin-3-like protein isoform X3 [Denticeps clupeoides]|uniref:nectin-3-like protein isoform X3 n=1 Tax=Denticeps clupeoides TaxID=299321 RepID=UPI0010A379AB|nr:nectin-3-like protein isoform X3 [Denticeps clupeoides]